MGKKPCSICKKLLTNVKRHLKNQKKCEPPKEIVENCILDLPIKESEESEQIKNVPIVEDMKEYIDEESNIEIKNGEGLEYLNGIGDNTIDLILTDPPYIISNAKTGMNQHYIDVKNNPEKLNKTEKEWKIYWKEYVKKNNINEKDPKVLKQKEKQKEKYLKYGTIYGKKFAVKTDYGIWDSDFTL